VTDGREHVVLAYGPRDAPAPLVRIQRESLLERFPLRSGAGEKPLWQESVRHLVQRGAGYASFVPMVGFDATLHERRGDLDAAATLLAHHLRGRPAHVLCAPGRGVASGDVADDDAAACAALTRRGVDLLSPVLLARRRTVPADAARAQH
jgi:hypothetical protein